MCEATETATSGKADSNTQEAATHHAPRECRRSEPDERVKGLVEALERIASDHIKPEPSVYGHTRHLYHADCDACHRQEIAREALSTYQDKPSE